MALREGDISGHTIVLIGRFNASILQPAWLEAQGLFEGRNLELREQMIVPPITALNLGWMSLEVTDDRAAFATLEESTSPAPLRDFVVDLFRVLEHTPIWSLGMNHTLHFSLRDGGWEHITGSLAPGGVLADRHQGARLSSTTWEIPRVDGLNGVVNLTLQPSQRLSGGVFADWNSHVDLAAAAPSAGGARQAVEVLQTRWDDDRRNAAETFQFIRGLA